MAIKESKEIWQCNECQFPCKVEIEYGGPKDLGQRFNQKEMCLCSRPNIVVPVWKCIND